VVSRRYWLDRSQPLPAASLHLPSARQPIKDRAAFKYHQREQSLQDYQRVQSYLDNLGDLETRELVRKAIDNLQAAKEQIRQLSQERDLQRTSIQRLQSENDGSDTRIEELTRERDTARTDANRLGQERDQLTEQRDGALNNITSLQQERDKIDPGRRHGSPIPMSRTCQRGARRGYPLESKKPDTAKSPH